MPPSGPSALPRPRRTRRPRVLATVPEDSSAEMRLEDPARDDITNEDESDRDELPVPLGLNQAADNGDGPPRPAAEGRANTLGIPSLNPRLLDHVSTWLERDVRLKPVSVGPVVQRVGKVLRAAAAHRSPPLTRDVDIVRAGPDMVVDDDLIKLALGQIVKETGVGNLSTWLGTRRYTVIYYAFRFTAGCMPGLRVRTYD